MRSGAGLVEPFRGVQRPRDMWRSVLLGVVLAGVLAGCSLGGASGDGGTVPTAVACAATLGRPAKALGAPVGGFAVGRGPVYAVFDVIPRYVPTTTGSVVHYGNVSVHGFDYVKVLWLVPPGKDVTAEISGERLPAGPPARFVGAGARLVLRPASDQSTGFVGWRSTSSGVLLPGAGCYQLNVKLSHGGTGSSASVEFRAES